MNSKLNLWQYPSLKLLNIQRSRNLIALSVPLTDANEFSSGTNVIRNALGKED